ncbi:hypothetical protein N7535_001566 [Penicillium sp. DV-2018c]|nr:hypothetical protein N7535_001566 [Penicillium sp. DV-2018c]
MTFSDRILHYIYGLPPPTSGNRKEPMQVLAVGISRSGTESLREALHILGFNHTHHGFDTILPPSSLEAMYRLLQKKYTTGEDLTAKDFDRILSNSVGVSDLFAAEFASELIAAYPNAKVILNVRRDLDSWYQKILLIGTGNNDAAIFQGSFASNGKWVYQQHVAMIRGLGLPEDRLLQWSVEDGWEPLCRFLGKPVPGTQFPNGNPPKAWAARIVKTMEAHHRRAVRNMLLFVAVIMMVVATLLRYLWEVI